MGGDRGEKSQNLSGAGVGKNQGVSEGAGGAQCLLRHMYGQCTCCFRHRLIKSTYRAGDSTILVPIKN
jgi:hypothetical protein